MIDLGTTFLSSVDRCPQAIAISYENKSLNYSNWLVKISSLAICLKKMGLRKGDKLMTLLPNTFEACTILFNNEPVRSCLMLAPQIDNGEITTIEGISENSSYNDLRKAFKKYHALQCGYCTPGFITTIVYLLEKKQFLKEEEIREKLSGNICRCTGYTGIVKAVEEVFLNRFKKSKND